MNQAYQTTKQTNSNNQNNDICVGFTTKTKFMLLQLRQRRFWRIHIQISQQIDKFRTFHPSLHESVTAFSASWSSMSVLDQYSHANRCHCINSFSVKLYCFEKEVTSFYRNYSLRNSRNS